MVIRKTWKWVFYMSIIKHKKIKLYSFGAKINNNQSNITFFDCHCIPHLIDTLKTKGYEIEWLNLSGDGSFTYNNDCNVLINQGSFNIFEFEDKTFKTWDCGDHPSLSLKLCKSKNFIGAAIGQYNKQLWDDNIKIKILRDNIKPGVHTELHWQFGDNNYKDIYLYRNQIKLDERLLWRGSLYEDRPDINEFKGRQFIIKLKEKLKEKFIFGYFRIPFDEYIKESINYKLVLCSGVGGGYSCGDYCFRDADMYALGIPTIRPKYAIETYIPLIPDYHYISVDPEFDESFKYKNHDKIADKIIKRYNETINDDEYLKYIANNARKWYNDSIVYPNIIENIIKSLDL